MEVTDTPEGKVPSKVAANAGSTEVARSADSAKRQDLNFITANNKMDAEYQLPVTGDAKGTWVRRCSSLWLIVLAEQRVSQRKLAECRPFVVRLATVATLRQSIGRCAPSLRLTS